MAEVPFKILTPHAAPRAPRATGATGTKVAGYFFHVEVTGAAGLVLLRLEGERWRDGTRVWQWKGTTRWPGRLAKRSWTFILFANNIMFVPNKAKQLRPSANPLPNPMYWGICPHMNPLHTYTKKEIAQIKNLKNIQNLQNEFNTLKNTENISNKAIIKTLKSLEKMMKKIIEIETIEIETLKKLKKRKDFTKIQLFLKTLLRSISQDYLKRVDRYISKKFSNNVPQEILLSAHWRDRLDKAIRHHLSVVAQKGVYLKPWHALPNTYKALKKSHEKVVREEETMGKLATLPLELQQIIVDLMDDQIATKLITGLFELPESNTSHTRVPAEITNAFLQYMLNTENKETLHKNKDSKLHYKYIGSLLSVLRRIMQQEDWEPTTSETQAISQLNPTGLRRWQELVKRSRKFGNKKRLPVPTRSATNTRPPRNFPGRQGTNRNPRGNIFTNRSGQLPTMCC